MMAKDFFLEERTFAVQSFGEEAGKEVLPSSKENFYTHQDYPQGLIQFLHSSKRKLMEQNKKKGKKHPILR